MIDADEALTYAELDCESHRVSKLLIDRLPSGRGDTPRIALHGPASVSYLVCLLAIWRAEASYLPLPVEQPPARRQGMCDDARPTVILALPEMLRLRALARTNPTSAARDEGHHDLDLDREAYVFFTSGSTGRPKGVPILHRALANRLRWMAEEHKLGPGDVLLQKASLGFDVSLVEMLGPLLSGAAVRILPRERSTQLDDLVDAIVEHGVTAAVFMPVQLQQLLEHPRAPQLPLRRVFTGGEAFGIELVRDFYRVLPQAALFSGYGPTEATISVTSWHARPNSTRVALGTPLPNIDLVVIADGGVPVLEEGVGELLLAGPCLTSGYVTRDTAKDTSFVGLPVDGGTMRFYRTGDIVRREGEHLYFVGRRDTQLKVRGVRIELEEIERVLRDGPGVADAAVAATSNAGEVHLVGFARPVPGTLLDLQSLRIWLSSRLPVEMLPRLRLVAELPLTPTGKLDRETLLNWARAPQARPGQTERGSSFSVKLAECWQQILGHEDFDDESDFFEIGGHSLNVVSLASLVRQKCGIEPGLASFFENSRFAGQAQFLSLLESENADSKLDALENLPNFAQFLVVQGALCGPLLAALGETASELFAARLGAVRTPKVDLQCIDLASAQAELEDLLLATAVDGTDTENLELRAFRVGDVHVLSVKYPACWNDTAVGYERKVSDDFGELALQHFPELKIAQERDPLFAERGTLAPAFATHSARRAVRRLIDTANRLSVGGNSTPRSREPCAFSGLERFHSQCLLSIIEGYARTIWGHQDHARLLGEHSILYSSTSSVPTLTHVAPDFRIQRENLSRYYGITFSRRELNQPLRDIAISLQSGLPVLLDFDFTHLPHRREYDGEPSYHAIVAVGLDARRHAMLAYEQTSGLIRIPWSEVEAYFSGRLPSGQKPGQIVCESEGRTEKLSSVTIDGALGRIIENLSSKAETLGLNGLELAIDEASARPPSLLFWFEGIWAFSHDLNGLVRYLDAAERDLARQIFAPEERAKMSSVQTGWHRVDTLFENARLTSDASLSALALREMRRLVTEQRQLVGVLEVVRRRVTSS